MKKISLSLRITCTSQQYHCSGHPVDIGNNQSVHTHSRREEARVVEAKAISFSWPNMDIWVHFWTASLSSAVAAQQRNMLCLEQQFLNGIIMLIAASWTISDGLASPLASS